MVDFKRAAQIEQRALAFGDLREIGMDGLIGPDAVEKDIAQATGPSLRQEFVDVEASAVRLMKGVTDEFKGI